MQDNKNNVILVQGMVDTSLLDLLKERKETNIYILEGRPSLKAARILSREFNKREITPTLIADNMAGFLFNKNLVKEVWLAYQEADGEGALCGIGALILGVLAKRHTVPVYLFPAAHKSRKMGRERDIFEFNGRRVAPQGIHGYAPLTEHVPGRYISKIYKNGSVH